MSEGEKSQLAQYVEEHCQKLGMSQRELCRKTGISRSTLFKLLHGDTKKANLSTLLTLAHAIKTHPIQLFRACLNEIQFPKYANEGAVGKHDAVGFIEDVTFPDYSPVMINSTFTKVWKIQNIGDQIWLRRKLICIDKPPQMNIDLPEGVEPPSMMIGLTPTQRVVPIEDTFAGGYVDIAVEFTAPPYPCTVYSYWKMVDSTEKNFYFPKSQGIYCLVSVVAA
jgi:transcriptional regulator with XRE-family HTH domain